MKRGDFCAGDWVSQSVDRVTTTYVTDTATPLTMVLAETTGTETIYGQTQPKTIRLGLAWHGLDLVAQSKLRPGTKNDPK